LCIGVHAGYAALDRYDSHHRVSENAGDKEPASLLAVFVVDSTDTALTAADKE